MTRIPFFLFLLTIWPALAAAGLTVNPGVVVAPEGGTSVTAAIPITGGDLVTDFAGVIQAGSPPVAGPTITAVSYAGSIWGGAAGGFVAFPTPITPGATVETNASLVVAGQKVAGTGTLATVTYNITGVAAGDYPIRLTGTSYGNSVLLNGITTVPTTFVSGILRIVGGLEGWRLLNWPGDAPNPLTEASTWGDEADPDRDGLANLMEFYLGTDPKVPTFHGASAATTGRPVLSLTTGNPRYVRLSYTRRIAAAPATASVQSSAGLAGWSTADLADDGTPVTLAGGKFQFVTKRFLLPVGPAQPSRFLRLVVDNPGP